MVWRPLSARAGQRTDVMFDSEGRATIRTLQDDTAIIDANRQAMANDPNRGWRMGREWRHYATIPNNILHKWLVEDGFDASSNEQPEVLARKLNDPDNRYLRTAPGHIGVSNGVAR